MPVSEWRQHRIPDHDGLRLGRKLHRIRNLRGETQTNFARRFRVSLATYMRWERYGPPRSPMLRKGIRDTLHALDKHSLYQKHDRLG